MDVQKRLTEQELRSMIWDNVAKTLVALTQESHSLYNAATSPADSAYHLAQARAYETARFLLRSVIAQAPG